MLEVRQRSQKGERSGLLTCLLFNIMVFFGVDFPALTPYSAAGKLFVPEMRVIVTWAAENSRAVIGLRRKLDAVEKP